MRYDKKVAQLADCLKGKLCHLAVLTMKMGCWRRSRHKGQVALALPRKQIWVLQELQKGPGQELGHFVCVWGGWAEIIHTLAKARQGKSVL
jgi:hypothetical protein